MFCLCFEYSLSVEILTCKGSWPADEGGGGGDTPEDVEQAAYLVGILDHALVSRVEQVFFSIFHELFSKPV